MVEKPSSGSQELVVAETPRSDDEGLRLRQDLFVAMNGALQRDGAIHVEFAGPLFEGLDQTFVVLDSSDGKTHVVVKTKKGYQGDDRSWDAKWLNESTHEEGYVHFSRGARYPETTRIVTGVDEAYIQDWNKKGGLEQIYDPLKVALSSKAQGALDALLHLAGVKRNLPPPTAHFRDINHGDFETITSIINGGRINQRLTALSFQNLDRRSNPTVVSDPLLRGIPQQTPQ